MTAVAPRARLAELGLFLCALIWGSTFFVVKQALTGVSPTAMIAWRFWIAAAVSAPFALRRRRPLAGVREAAVLSSILFVLFFTQTAGLQYTTAANSGFITGLFVLFVPVELLVLFKKPPTPAQWAASAVAVAGLWLLTGGVREINRGDALTVLAAVTYAGHLLVTDKYVRSDADPFLLAFHQFWMTAALATAAGLARGDSFRVAPGGWTTISLLALFPTFGCFYVQLVAQKEVSPLKASLIFTMEPVFSALFAWTLGGETFRPACALGGGMIVAAMLLGELSKLGALKGRRKEVLPA